MRFTRSLVAAAAGVALAASALTGVGAATAAPAATPTVTTLGTKPLAAVVTPYASTWNTSWNDYNIVTHAVFAVLKAKPTSKVGVLAKGDVALTAFLPTDRAFQILVKQLTGKTLLREREVFGVVAKLGIPTVEKVLLYHVVPGATITSAMALKSNGATLRTALGLTIHVAVYPGPVISLWDKAYKFRNPRVILSQLDINKGNKQIAHGIDRVLLPFQP
ncbi:MAG TPA: fasciclin domain-containing protein [Candidatus Nanopelagicales bacterium]|nr:fasciclin domain-containing protein [Candidatus Nanopelagicales bacterium]